MTLSPLLRADLSLFLRRPMTWLVLGSLFAAMLIGAHIGATRVVHQEQTIERLLAQEQQSLGLAREAARRYASPSPLELEYHRDPTDAFGYMNYFLVAHAYKLPAPLAALAVGQSDLRPFFERLDFTHALEDEAYEPESPRLLAAGSFDLVFVLVYIAPLAVIALAGMTLSAEHDSGVLRMIAAHPVSPSQVAAAKFAGPGVATALLMSAMLVLALLFAGSLHSAGDALAPFALVIASFVGYVLFWFAAAAAVATLWRGAAPSVAILVSAWTLVCLIIPLAAGLLISKVAVAPSRIAYVDASRAAMDAFFADEHAAYSSYLAARPQYAHDAPVLIGSSPLKRFARDEAYSAPLRERADEFERHQARVAKWTAWLRVASPALAMDGVLQNAAGTDAPAYERFETSARSYTSQLRQFFEPIALMNAARGEKRSCESCPGRMNFTTYDSVPPYKPAEATAGVTIASACYMLMMWLAAAALTLVAAARLRAWPN